MDGAVGPIPEAVAVGGVVITERSVRQDGGNFYGAALHVGAVCRNGGHNVRGLHHEGLGNLNHVVIQGEGRAGVTGCGRCGNVMLQFNAPGRFGAVEGNIAEQVRSGEFHAEGPLLVVAVVLVPGVLEIGFGRGNDHQPEFLGAFRYGVGDVRVVAHARTFRIYAAAVVHKSHKAHVPAGDGRVGNAVEARSVGQALKANGQLPVGGNVDADVVEAGGFR